MIEIRESAEAAGVPGCYFQQGIVDRDVRYFTAYIDEQPVGQLVLLRRGQLWWTDYLYVQEGFRGRGIVRALVQIVLPAAAEVTNYTWGQCEGVTPEELHRTSQRYSIRTDILSTYTLPDGRPATVMRRHVASLRQPRPAAQAAL